MSNKTKISDKKRARLRDATRRYRARKRGEIVPLLRAANFVYPQGQCDRDRVKYSCVKCGNECETRRGRIKPLGGICRICAIRVSVQERIDKFGTMNPPEVREKMRISATGRAAPWNKNKIITPEQRAKMIASLRALPDGKRGGADMKRLDPVIRLMRKMVRVAARDMVRRVLRIQRNTKKLLRTFEYLGYSKNDLINHLESGFSPGMTWKNYGEWHIDHIKPIAAWIAEGVTDMKTINALSNLQPLWAHENLKKHATWPYSMVIAS